MATGQAAGALAALAANGDAQAVPMEDLRSVLRKHDAIVPPELSRCEVGRTL